MRSSLLTLVILSAPAWSWGQFVWLPQPVVVAPAPVVVSPDGVTHYYLVPGPVVTERVERYFFEGTLPPDHSTAGIASSRSIAPTVRRIVREYHYQDKDQRSSEGIDLPTKPVPQRTPSAEPPDPPTEADTPEDDDDFRLPPPVNGNGEPGSLRMYPAPEEDANLVVEPRKWTKRFARWFDSVLGEGFASTDPVETQPAPAKPSPDADDSSELNSSTNPTPQSL